MRGCQYYKSCHNNTFHLFNSEGRVLLDVGELILKFHWDITVKFDCPGLTLSNWCWVKRHIAGKVSGAHNRVSMNRDQDVLLIL